MNVSNKLFTLFVGACCAFAALPVAADSTGFSHAELESGIDAILAPWDKQTSPGAAVAIISHGEIVFAKGYGMASLEYGIPITADTPFHAASVSKQFTGMAVTLLARQGRIDVSNDVRTYLPWVPSYSAPITIDHLLHHSSGLRDQWQLLALAGWQPGDTVTQEQAVALIARQQHLNFAPGTDYQYSNSGYTLLAETVTAVAGMPFPEFLSEQIFEPLEMTRSSFHGNVTEVIGNRAYSYVETEPGKYDRALLNYATYGATSLFTTANDLVRWLDNFRHCAVGGCEAVGDLLKPSKLQIGSGFDNYGRGVLKSNYRGLELWSHDGRDAGFRSTARWIVEAEFGLAILANLGSFEPQQVANAIIDQVLADQLAPVATEQPEPETPQAIDPEEAQIIVGRYILSNGQDVEITRIDHKLQIRSSDQQASLVPTTAGQYTIPEFGAAVAFDLAAGEPARQLTLHFLGRTLPGFRVDGDQAPPEHVEGMYEGDYYCAELATVYSVEYKQGQLLLTHLQRGQRPLIGVGKDRFVNEFLGEVTFRKSEDGAVVGLLGNSGFASPFDFERIRPNERPDEGE